MSGSDSGAEKHESQLITTGIETREAEAGPPRDACATRRRAIAHPSDDSRAGATT